MISSEPFLPRRQLPFPQEPDSGMPWQPLLTLSLCPSSTGRRPDQPGRGLPLWREVNSLVQPPELQILEETEQGAQASGSQGPHPRAWKHGELGHRFAPPSGMCSTWVDGRKSLSQNWWWLGIGGGGNQDQRVVVWRGRRDRVGKTSAKAQVAPICNIPPSPFVLSPSVLCLTEYNLRD